MAYRNQNREPTLEISAEFPPYIDTEDFVSSLQWTPYIVENGLPEQHEIVFYAGEKRNDLKKMSDDDLVLRAIDQDHVCSLRAFQRGYNFIESTAPTKSVPGVRPGTYIGAIETQVLAAKHKGYSVSESQIIAEVGQLMEPIVQESLRDKLFTRIQAMTAREVSPLEFRSFVQKLAEYDPPYDLDRAQVPASELAMKVFMYQKEKYGQRGVAKIELDRLRQVFDAIGAKNPDVQADKYAIVHHNRIIDVDRPRALVDKAMRHLTGKPRARTLERVDNLYTTNFGSYLGKEPESIVSFIPRPSLSQEATARALSEASAAAARIAEIDAAKVAQRAVLGVSSAGLVASTLFGAQSAYAAERAPASVAFQINTESVAAFSALPNRAESENNAANRALRAEIDRRVAHSKQLGGRMAEWQTVDADTLYASILKYEKEYNTDPKERFLVLAQLTHESALKVDAVSVVGAKGMSQFMDGTWKTYGGGRDPFDPDAAVQAQFRYNVHLRKLMKERFPHMSEDDLTALRIAAYNCGENNHYIKAGRIPPISFANGQTYNYTKSIMKDYHHLVSMSGGPSTTTHPDTHKPKKHAPNVGVHALDLASVLAGGEDEAATQTNTFVSVDAILAMPAEDDDVSSVTKFDIDAVKANLDALLGVPATTNSGTATGASVNPDVSQQDQTHQDKSPSSTTPTPTNLPSIGDVLGTPPAAGQAPSTSTPAPGNTPGTDSPGGTPLPGDTTIDNKPNEQSAASALPSISDTTSQAEIPTLPTVPDAETTSPDPAAISQQPDSGMNDITAEVNPEAPEQQSPEQQLPKDVNKDVEKKVKSGECPTGTTTLGIYKISSGKSMLCAINNLPSTSEESQPGNKRYMKGADGHAIVEQDLAAQLQQMVSDAAKDGITLTANSSFRTFAHQKELWDASGHDANVVAPPGHSLHNAGNAVDFDLRVNSPKNCTMVGVICTSPNDKVYDWLVNNAGKYGFGQYYKEAWHWDTLQSHWAKR